MPDLKYDFDEELQTAIVALLMKDADFCRRTEGLILPSYFDNEAEARIVDIALNFFKRHREPPTGPVWIEVFKHAAAAGKIAPAIQVDMAHKMRDCFKLEPRNRSWLLENVGEFARQQAYTDALTKAAAQIATTTPDRFERINEVLKKANDVGLGAADADVDYFASISDRTQERLDRDSGKTPRTGITTGVKELDELLHHRGYGRKELSVWMGGAKSGKSFALIQACASAVLAGKNALHITLENSKAVCFMRYDAYFSEIGISQHDRMPHSVESAIRDIAARPGIGKLKVREFPSGTFRPRDLRRLIDEYKVEGHVFDVIAIDYLDIMAPDERNDSPIENSKQIWIGVRAIMQEEDVAGVSATQTNRTGHTAAVAKAEHVAEDFNRIRTADLVLSINRTDDEKSERKARIYLAAGRNQSDGVTIFVSQNLDLARSVDKVESVE